MASLLKSVWLGLPQVMQWVQNEAEWWFTGGTLNAARPQPFQCTSSEMHSPGVYPDRMPPLPDDPLFESPVRSRQAAESLSEKDDAVCL